MSAHNVLDLLNDLGKRDKMLDLPSILAPFRNEFNKFTKTGARMLDSVYIYDIRSTLKSHFGVKILSFCHIYRRHCVTVIDH